MRTRPEKPWLAGSSEQLQPITYARYTLELSTQLRGIRDCFCKQFPLVHGGLFCDFFTRAASAGCSTCCIISFMSQQFLIVRTRSELSAQQPIQSAGTFHIQIKMANTVRAIYYSFIDLEHFTVAFMFSGSDFEREMK